MMLDSHLHMLGGQVIKKSKLQTMRIQSALLSS